MFSIDALLCDMDGTLVTVKKHYIHDVVGAILDELGIASDEQKREDIWYRYDREKILSGMGIDYAKFRGAYVRHLRESIEERERASYAYDDLPALRQLHEKGLKLAILTNSSSRRLQSKTTLTGISFDAAVCAYDSEGMQMFKKKPEPDMLYACMAEIGRERACFIGNGDEDVLAARAASIPCVLIDRGENSFSEKADIVIRSLHEMDEVLRNGL